jgi:ABC-2 type transport system ATP-binding protein
MPMSRAQIVVSKVFRSRTVWVAAVGAALLCAPAASARDYVVTSFDGTPIVAHFFSAPDLKPGERQPTLLYGPGWSGSGQTDTEEVPTIDQAGLGALLDAGYNVVTWDPRGFGGSGDVSHVDGPDYEARDVSALIDLIANQPEAQLDSAEDPRVGMVGGSYGGGIQWVTAGTDSRVDVMVPNSSWHSLETSLFPDGAFKMGIASLLYGLGATQGTTGGLTSPAGPQTGSMDPHVTSLYTEAMTTGTISPENAEWFRSRGPWNVLGNVKIPTFIVQGKVDILFTLTEAIRNYQAVSANGAPLKMLWYCGGHGTCLDDPGTDAEKVPRETLAWLARYLRGDKSVDTGPGFEWISQDGVWHAAPSYPPAPAKQPLAVSGSGTLVLHPSPGTGSAQFAGSSPEGVNVDIPAVIEARVEIVGEPKLSITYSGTADSPTAFAYAQIVDLDSGNVVGNQATPLPLILDGASHTIERRLNAIAHSATPSSRLQLQVIPATALYREQTSTGTVALEDIKIELPAVTLTPPTSPPAGNPAKTVIKISRVGRFSAGARKLRVRIRVRGQKVRAVRTTVLRTNHRAVARKNVRSVRSGGRGRVLTLRLRRPLRRGPYTLRARAVTLSGTPVQGRRIIRVR